MLGNGSSIAMIESQCQDHPGISVSAHHPSNDPTEAPLKLKHGPLIGHFGLPSFAAGASEEKPAEDQLDEIQTLVGAAAAKRGVRRLQRRKRAPKPRRAAPWVDGVTPKLVYEGLADDSFISEGLWACDAINVNCWTAASGYIERSAADFHLLQETKIDHNQRASTSIRDATATARSWKQGVVFEPCIECASGYPSAGTAVMARSHIGMASVPNGGYDDILKGRFTMQWVSAVCRKGFALCSIYGYDNEGAGGLNLDLLQAVAKTLSVLAIPWVLGGDFQMEPDELVRTQWCNLHICVVVPRWNPRAQIALLIIFW